MKTQKTGQNGRYARPTGAGPAIPNGLPPSRQVMYNNQGCELHHFAATAGDEVVTQRLNGRVGTRPARSASGVKLTPRSVALRADRRRRPAPTMMLQAISSEAKTATRTPSNAPNVSSTPGPNIRLRPYSGSPMRFTRLSPGTIDTSKPRHLHFRSGPLRRIKPHAWAL